MKQNRFNVYARSKNTLKMEPTLNGWQQSKFM